MHSKNPCQLNECCCFRAALLWRKPLYLLQGQCRVSESQQLLIKKKKFLLCPVCMSVCVSVQEEATEGSVGGKRERLSMDSKTNEGEYKCHPFFFSYSP